MLDINAPHDRRHGIGRTRASLDQLVRVTGSATAKPAHIRTAHVHSHQALRTFNRRGDWNELPG